MSKICINCKINNCFVHIFIIEHSYFVVKKIYVTFVNKLTQIIYEQKPLKTVLEVEY